MKINKILIPLTDTGYFSTLVTDYVSGSEKLMPFYKYAPQLSSFKKAIDDAEKKEYPRQVLSDMLEEQYKASGISDEGTMQAIDSLKSKKTFTVTTGHQLSLFTGPLYFIYKIITTINLAETLKKEYPEYHFIPVYWMAGEDHDFEEINHIHLFGKKISWKQPEKGATGDILTETLHPVIEELKAIMGESANADELGQLFKEAYMRHNNLADATRFLVHRLFAHYGLLIVNGNNRQLKAQFKKFINDDIFDNTNKRIIDETIENLTVTGVVQKSKVQITPREINCFYMKKGLRERIEKKGPRFEVLNTSVVFTEDELLTEIDNHPKHFSPNVVLRPMYQQHILPNLAYIGGPAEISYWLELYQMFRHHQVNFPVLLLRNSLLWIDEPTAAKMKKLNIPEKDIFLSTDELIKKIVSRKAGDEIDLSSEREEITKLFNAISGKAENIDATLRKTVQAELHKALGSLHMIESKLLKAEKQKSETELNQIYKIKERLFPGGMLQERHDNFIPFYLRHGANFIKLLKERLNPFEPDFIILTEEQ